MQDLRPSGYICNILYIKCTLDCFLAQGPTGMGHPTSIFSRSPALQIGMSTTRLSAGNNPVLIP